MREILAVVIMLSCATVAAQEPTEATRLTKSKTDASKKLRDAEQANETIKRVIEARLLGEQFRLDLFDVSKSNEEGEQSNVETPEAERLEQKLRHISHLASQAAHTTDLDVIEEKLREMEQELVEARATLWNARDAEAEASKAKREKVEAVQKKDKAEEKHGAEGKPPRR